MEKKEKKEMIAVNDYDSCEAHEIAATNTAAFSKYENLYAGREVVVLATGPTLNEYEPIDRAIHIGINTIYDYKKVNLDYYVAYDFENKLRAQSFYDGIASLSCKVFLGKTLGKTGELRNVSESFAHRVNAVRFFWDNNNMFHTNICFYPLVSFGGTIFAALQFALYTNPRKIYLAGCDASDQGKFNGDAITNEQVAKNIPLTLTGYEQFKKFAHRYYPDTEIISFNPVGLKGMFKDIYTK